MASNQYRLKGLREQRGKIQEELRRLGDVLRKEERAMSGEEKAAFGKLKDDFAAVSESIRTCEADILAVDQAILANDTPADAPPADAPPAAAPMQNSKRTPGREDRDYRPAPADFAARAHDLKLCRNAWLRRQMGKKISRAQKEAVERSGFNLRAPYLDLRMGDPATRRQRMEQRVLTVTTSGGGYLIAEDYSHELEQKLVSFSGVRGVCREFQTTTGADLPWPTEDDTGNTGELLAINTEVAYADPTFASVTFGSYKFSSKGVIAPNELVQDSDFDLDPLIFGEIGTRLGRIEGSYHTTGTGSSQPKGVVACASAGLTTAAAAAFTADELTKLMVAVDPAYLVGPKVGYMMKHDVLAYALMLKDANGHPLVRESYTMGMGVSGMDGANAGVASGVTINGFPVFLNQNMTGLTSSVPVTATKHVLFGNFEKFIIRDAGPVRVYRADERLIEKDQVLFVGFKRSDSNCVNTAAIKYLLQA